MKFKRFFSLLLALSLIAVIFAGCGNQSATGNASAAGTSAVETTSADAASVTEQEDVSAVEPASTKSETSETESTPAEDTSNPTLEFFPLDNTVYLTMFSTDPLQFKNLTEDVTTLRIYEEMQARTNVRVDFLYGVDEGWGLMMAADTYPDMIENVSSKYGGGMAGAIDDNLIIDLTDVITDYMPNYQAVVDSNSEYTKCSVLDDGRTGAIIGFWEEGYPVTSGPVVRKDWVDELGVNPSDIVTYDDVHDLLVQFKNTFGTSTAMWINQYGCPIGNYFSAGFGVAALTALAQNRNAMYQVDGVVKYGPIEDGYFEYLQLVNQWYSEGLIYKDFASNNPSIAFPPDEIVANEGVGFMHVGNNFFAKYDALGIEYVAITDPVQTAGETTHFNSYNSLTTGSGICLSSDCHEVEVAARWLDYRFSDEGYILWNFGVEGEAFEYDENGAPQWTALITDNPDYAMSDAINVYARSAGVFLVNWEKNMFGYTDNQLAAPAIWTSTSDYDYVFPLGAELSTDETELYNQRYNDIATYVNEMTLKFMIGEEKLSPESFEAFRSRLKDMEVDVLVECYQGAYNRYITR